MDLLTLLQTISLHQGILFAGSDANCYSCFRLVPSNFIQTVELNEKKTQQMRRMSQQRMSVAPVIGAPSANTANTGTRVNVTATITIIV